MTLKAVLGEGKANSCPSEYCVLRLILVNIVDMLELVAVVHRHSVVVVELAQVV